VEFEELSGVHNALKVNSLFQIILCVCSFSFLCVVLCTLAVFSLLLQDEFNLNHVSVAVYTKQLPHFRLHQLK
jgi:hypothetical protein